MEVFKTGNPILITCNRRLAPFLQQEVIELGFEIVRVFPSGVEIWGTLTDCIKLNMHLRCASQVLYSLKKFNAYTPDDLYRQLVRLPWDDVITEESYFSVTSNVHHPTIKTDLFANVKVKDAIVDSMRRNTGARPNSGAALDGAVFHLYWNEKGAEIFIDTSGETLAKHGYRKIPGKAPMLEALAAATILTSRWDRKSPFINPMCGSGTVAIEAALIATNRYPGLYRSNYSFMHINGYDHSVYENALAELKNKITEVPGLKIIASDISADAIAISKINAGVAGVEELITFMECDFRETPIPEGVPGVVYFNPEYGERLGDVEALVETYEQIGDFMKQKCKDYLGYIFTGNLDLAKNIWLKPKRRIEFYTATIDCRLYEYELYKGSRERKDEDSSTKTPLGPPANND